MTRVLKVEVIAGNTGGILYDILNNARVVLPWQVSAIKITFSEPVTVGNSDLTLVKVVAGGNTAPTLTLSGNGTTELTWTFDILKNLLNLQLDLNTPGVDPITALVFWIVYGDADGDKKVLSNDGTLVRNMGASGLYYLFYDIDGDGVVTQTTDFNIVRGRTGTGFS